MIKGLHKLPYFVTKNNSLLIEYFGTKQMSVKVFSGWYHNGLSFGKYVEGFLVVFNELRLPYQAEKDLILLSKCITSALDYFSNYSEIVLLVEIVG